MTAALAQPKSRDAQLRALGRRFQRPARDALIIVGIGRALWYFFVQGIQPWNFLGVDARLLGHRPHAPVPRLGRGRAPPTSTRLRSPS